MRKIRSHSKDDSIPPFISRHIGIIITVIIVTTVIITLQAFNLIGSVIPFLIELVHNGVIGVCISCACSVSIVACIASIVISAQDSRYGHMLLSMGVLVLSIVILLAYLTGIIPVGDIKLLWFCVGIIDTVLALLGISTWAELR